MWRNLETIAMETLPPDASTQQSFPAKPPPHATRGADDGDGSDDGEDLGEEDQSEASNNIDWIQGMFGQNYNADSQFFSSDPLLITLAEETAETYILGRSHYEYSKVGRLFCVARIYPPLVFFFSLIERSGCLCVCR